MAADLASSPGRRLLVSQGLDNLSAGATIGTMKPRHLLCVSATLCVLLARLVVIHAQAPAPAAAGAPIAVTATLRADQPGPVVNPHIYGHFAEHLGRGIYEGIWVGPESPISNTRGNRNDVLAALKALDIPVLRWPGGCFADEYHWKDGIGPREKRPSMINTHWGGVVEDNSFGTHEFMDLVELLGTDAYITGNVGSGTAQEMMEWVEYLTSDAVSPMANLRRQNGRDKAWRVPYFGIGNEPWGCGGNMRAEYYADEFRKYNTFIKNYDRAKPIDRIFDSYLARGVKPLVEIGFMPEALSIQPQPYRHEWRPGLPYNRIYTGWSKPPRDYARWGELAYQWTKHSVEKYGADEVATWWWEVWNEANNQPNGYNGTMYSSYTAAVFARKHELAARHAVNLEGAVTWAFTFEDQPYFAGFRQIASNGIPLPVFNVFRMYALMGPDRLRATSSSEVPLETIITDGVRATPDVGVLASRAPGQVAIMVWHYHDDDVSGPDAAVTLAMTGLPAGVGNATMTHYRIDQQHSNAYAEWLRMGSPIAPDPAQYAAMQKASDLATLQGSPATIGVDGGKATLAFTLPRQGVSLLVVRRP
jgi:hypothetical protein